jgi:hypothetical protein
MWCYRMFPHRISRNWIGWWPGDSVVIYGAGPVGGITFQQGPVVVDSHPDRLAEELGAIPIDFRKVPLWNRYWTKGVGADKGCMRRVPVVTNMARSILI